MHMAQGLVGPVHVICVREVGETVLTRACSRRSRLSRRLLAQAPRQPSSLLKHVVSWQEVPR